LLGINKTEGCVLLLYLNPQASAQNIILPKHIIAVALEN